MTPNLFPLEARNDSIWFFTHGTWNIIKREKKECRLECGFSSIWELGGRVFKGWELPGAPGIRRHRRAESPLLLDFSAASDTLAAPLSIKPSSTLDFCYPTSCLPQFTIQSISDSFDGSVSINHPSEISLRNVSFFLIMSLQFALFIFMAFVEMTCKFLCPAPWVLDSFKCLVDMSNLR